MARPRRHRERQRAATSEAAKRPVAEGDASESSARKPSANARSSSSNSRSGRTSGVFEDQFVRQGRDEDRTIEGTLDLGWKLLGHIPTAQLTRLDRKLIEEFYPKGAGSAHATPAKK